MLQIKNISKKYVTGELTTMALDDVSLNFRDNEFVAILGPSGSGKTTLLNVIGGLDRYDEGDLIINGISTKQYTDRDWDSYRNHTIGFVFQSYNLIPQQSVLSNVEIALTISGVSRAERRQRAIDALNEVGLGDQLHKRPNQMSGGQMQRVAIARALVNNPDILLADEPTGALDTETSVQVMDLLKEVAKDRSVIMVTHNPDLAEKYATRIVRLQDGQIIGDSDPCIVDETDMEEPVHQNMGHSSMTMATSLGLSVNNLIAKRGRTLLTCFAGAIGIIAITLILAVSAGVNNYIDALEEDTMAEYPIEVTSSGFDISNMMSTMMGTVEQVLDNEEQEEGFRVMTMISRMVNVITSNELGPFKDYLESGETDIYEYAKAVEYLYDVEPQIYLEDGDDYHQVNPESTLTSGFGLGETLTSMMSSMFTMLNTFYQLPEDEDLYIDSYDVKAGHWPENYNECVLVISSTGQVADYMVYTLGLEDFNEYVALIDEAMNGGEVPEVEYEDFYSYDSVIGTTYKLVNNTEYYEYDEEYEVWTDKRDNEKFMRQLVADGEDITIVGVVQAREDATTAILTDGINYPASLIEHIAEVSAESKVVKDQMDHPDVNVLTGEEFGEDFSMDLASIFDFDQDAFAEMLDIDALMDTFLEELDFSSVDMGSFDMSEMFDFGSMDLSLDMSGMGLDMDFDIDLSGLDMDLANMDIDYSQMFASMDMSQLFKIDSNSITQLSVMLSNGYNNYVKENDLGSYEQLESDFADYLNTGASEIIIDYINSMVEEAVGDMGILNDLEALEKLFQESGGLEGFIDAIFEQFLSTLDAEGVSGLTTELMEGYQEYAKSSGATSAEDISSSLTAYMTSSEATQMFTNVMMSMMDQNALTQMVATMMDSVMAEMMGSMTAMISEQIESQLSSAMGSMTSGMEDQLTASINDMMSSAMDTSSMTDQFTEILSEAMEGSMTESMGDAMLDAFQVDPDEVMEAFDIDMDEDSLLDLMSSMSSAAGTSYDGVLADLGYIDYTNPTEIDIYPKDFDSKDGITAIIDDYNVMVLDAGEEEKEISYSDLMGTMMSTVSTIINLVTYVLIAFVSISLIVSAIMIGIITYISVLERTREIGILRALGASKGNVARIFNAETFIVGLIAGIMGVVIGLLLLIPINAIVHNFVQDDSVRAFLPALYGVLLVVLSVVLTLIGGIIPSRKASKMDPVAALRSE